MAILYNLALFYHQQQRPKKAEVLLEKALGHAEALLGRNADPVDHILNRLADLQVKEHHYARAEGLYNRSLQIERRLYGPDNPRLAKKLMKVAWVHCLQTNYDSAEQYLREALDLQISAARTQQALAASNAAEPLMLEDDLLIDDLTVDEIELSDATN